MKLISILGKIYILILLATTLSANVNASLDQIAIYKGNTATLTLKATGSDIKFPNITSINGYRVLGTSSGSSVYIVNSKITKSESISYTFAPTKTITIKPFNITVNGQIEKTKSLQLKVIKPTISQKGDNFIFKLILSKHKVYAGEAIKANLEFSYKVGSNPLGVNLEKFAPEHFWIKKLKDTSAYEKDGYIIQSINYLLFPQLAGEQTIPNQIIEVTTREPKTNFLRHKRVLSNEAKINVLSLPNNISVQGDYKISAFIDKKEINANEPVNLTIKIAGFGNIDDIEPFKLNLNDAVVYSSKPKIISTITNNKYGGEFTQKISLIGENDFTIPSISFKYFDIKTKKIKEIKTKSFQIKVNAKTKNTPTIQTQNNIKSIPAKIIIKKEDSILKYIYGIVGFILGAGVYYIFSRKKSNKVDDKPIIVKIKKAKNDKTLYTLLLPYCQDKNFKKVIKDLEENIYNNGVNKIDKKEIIENLL